MALNKIAIFLRRDWKINRFREVIISTFDSPDISEMILCSGFFQENNYFSASNSFCNLNVSNKKSIKIVGVYSYSWRACYDDFYWNIVKNNPKAYLTAQKYKISSMKWHAKVMIGKHGGKPVIATIGSSNITGRAFGISKNFNYESDVVIWDDSISSIDAIMSLSFEGNMENSGEVIVSTYDESDWRNGNLSLEDKVIELENEIFKVAQRIL